MTESGTEKETGNVRREPAAVTDPAAGNESIGSAVETEIATTSLREAAVIAHHGAASAIENANIAGTRQTGNTTNTLLIILKGRIRTLND